MAESNGQPVAEFSPEALSYLQKLPFPGNIRELKNMVERTLLVSGRQRIEASDLERFGNVQSADVFSGTPFEGLTLEQLEKKRILQALDKYGNNLSKAAETLGISRSALYRRLEKYGIKICD